LAMKLSGKPGMKRESRQTLRKGESSWARPEKKGKGQNRTPPANKKGMVGDEKDYSFSLSQGPRRKEKHRGDRRGDRTSLKERLRKALRLPYNA